MDRRRSDSVRDWVYLTLGGGCLIVYFTAVYLGRVDEPNWLVVGSLCALAGRPVWSGLVEVISALGRSSSERTRRDDDRS